MLPGLPRELRVAFHQIHARLRAISQKRFQHVNIFVSKFLRAGKGLRMPHVLLWEEMEIGKSLGLSVSYLKGE